MLRQLDFVGTTPGCPCNTRALVPRFTSVAFVYYVRVSLFLLLSLCVCVCLRVIADGLVGAFVEDYPVLCERSDLTALEVQVNATRPGRFINLILKDENEPSTLSEIQLARKSVTP